DPSVQITLRIQAVGPPPRDPRRLPEDHVALGVDDLDAHRDLDLVLEDAWRTGVVAGLGVPGDIIVTHNPATDDGIRHLPTGRAHAERTRQLLQQPAVELLLEIELNRLVFERLDIKCTDARREPATAPEAVVTG